MTRDAYRRLGVARAINACGIYTDLGGSCLSPTVWDAVTQVNESFASLPELLDRSGASIAELVGAEAARVTPGASAAIALSIGACIAGDDGELMETLPITGDAPSEVILQRGHRYKYTRCALLAGATIVEAERDLSAAIGAGTAAFLFPAHLDGANGTVALEGVVELAREHDIPVVVDAAYMSYPTELLGSYTARGADLVCFSAKYFWGPNSGGFVCGRTDLVRKLAALDFTGFESGAYRTFGRAYKLDRSAVVATALALEEWIEMDHAARWEGYARRATAIQGRLGGLEHLDVELGCFTLDEHFVPDPVNGLRIRRRDGGELNDVVDALAGEDPSVRCVDLDSQTVVVCLETVKPGEDDYLAERLRERLTTCTATTAS